MLWLGLGSAGCHRHFFIVRALVSATNLELISFFAQLHYSLLSLPKLRLHLPYPTHYCHSLTSSATHTGTHYCHSLTGTPSLALPHWHSITGTPSLALTTATASLALHHCKTCIQHSLTATSPNAPRCTHSLPVDQSLDSHSQSASLHSLSVEDDHSVQTVIQRQSLTLTVQTVIQRQSQTL